MDRKIKIVIIQRIFASYRKPLFEALAKVFDFHLIHSENNSGIEQIIGAFSIKVSSFNYWIKSTTVFLSVLKPILRIKPDVIIHEFTPSILSLYLTYIFSLLTSTKFVLWGHGYNRKKGFHPEKRIADRIRLFFLKQSDAIILYTPYERNVLNTYLLEKKIFVAINTLNTKKLTLHLKKLEKIGRETLKRKHNIHHKYNLVFIGRLLDNKFPEQLLYLSLELKAMGLRDFGIHFVGDGESRNSLNDKVNLLKLRNIYFHGKIYDEQKTGELLFLSDLMVLPGAVGLSVIHAFCYLLPVITFAPGSNGPFHSPEVNYIIQNKTGFLAKNLDIKDMATLVYKYLTNASIRRRMKKMISEKIRNDLSLDQMIKGFTSCISFLTHE